MSFITLDGLGNAKEPEVQPEGVYNLQLDNVEVKPSANNPERTQVFHLYLSFPDLDDAKPFRSWVWAPTASDPADRAKDYSLQIKRAFSAFGVQFDGDTFDPEDGIGQIAANVTVGVEQDQNGNDVNTVRYWPRLKD